MEFPQAVIQCRTWTFLFSSVDWNKLKKNTSSSLYRTLTNRCWQQQWLQWRSVSSGWDCIMLDMAISSRLQPTCHRAQLSPTSWAEGTPEKMFQKGEVPHKQCEEWRREKEKPSREYQGHWRRRKEDVPGTKADFPAAHGEPWGLLAGMDGSLLKKLWLRNGPQSSRARGLELVERCLAGVGKSVRTVKMKCCGLTTILGLLRVRKQRIVEWRTEAELGKKRGQEQVI